MSKKLPEISDSRRYAAGVEYCGRNYSGWQRQKNAHSVQEVLENAFTRVANHPVRVITAGRTDRGVHGIGQVVHFDSPSARERHEWLRGVNTFLPEDIAVTWVNPVADDFHARFSAIERSYRYVLYNRQPCPAYFSGIVSWHRESLDIRPMQQAAQYLAGEHDFSAFRAAGCQAIETVKEVKSIHIDNQGPWFWLDITANGFLYNMVRIIMGVLLRIGEHKCPPEWVREVLASGDRKHRGKTALPDGLYFLRVAYPEHFAIPEPTNACKFW